MGNNKGYYEMYDESLNKETRLAAAILSYVDAIYHGYSNLDEWEEGLKGMGIQVDEIRKLAQTVARK
jgi:hypothetical protein